MRLDLLLARARLIEISRPSVEYCRANDIDFAATISACGGIFLAEIKPSNPWFDPHPGGVTAAWCDVLAENGEDVLDVVAWPVRQPDQVMTLGGVAPALGMAYAANPVNYSMGQKLQLFRTPRAWARARCEGATLLNRMAGARWLMDVSTSTLSVEDWQHGGEIRRSLSAVATKRVVVADRERAVA